MRIARPLLAVSTPIGVIFGLREAWHVRPILAVLMALLLAVVGGFIWATWRIARAEAQSERFP